VIDDRALRHEATRLLQAIQRERPAVAMAAHALDNSPSLAFVLEVRISTDGPTECSLVLDHPAHQEQTVMWMSGAEG
jgi:hypothetical protein